MQNLTREQKRIVTYTAMVRNLIDAIDYDIKNRIFRSYTEELAALELMRMMRGSLEKSECYKITSECQKKISQQEVAAERIQDSKRVKEDMGHFARLCGLIS